MGLICAFFVLLRQIIFLKANVESQTKISLIVRNSINDNRVGKIKENTKISRNKYIILKNNTSEMATLPNKNHLKK